MKKEIDQRNKDEVLIRCNCGGNHFISFIFTDYDNNKEFYIQMIDQPFNLWYRIKKAIKYIVKGGDLYYMDIGVTEKDLDKIVNLINKYKKI